MEGDIELDDIRVVNVTGKGYSDDKPRKSTEKKFSCFRLSLRLRTLFIFICFSAVIWICTVVQVVGMIGSLEDLDEDALHKSIDRFTSILFDDMYTMRWYAQHVARHELTARVAMDPSNRSQLNLFVQRFLNTTVAYHDDGTGERVYGCGSLINYWGIVHPVSFETLWYEYHPGDDTRYCTLPTITPDTPSLPSPIFPPEYLSNLILNSSTSDHPENGFVGIFSPLRVTYPMFVNVESIIIPDATTGNVTGRPIYGYLVSAKTMKYHIGTYANSVPGCIATIFTDDEVNNYTEFDKEMWDFDKEIWDTKIAGSLDPEEKTFTGVPNFTKRHVKDLKNPLRVCPSVPLFNDTDEMMTGYFRLCSNPPEKGVNNTCIFFRMDRPMSRLEEGTTPMIALAILIICLIIILFVLFIIFLDLAVLRRVVNLSNTIRKQTLQHHEDFKDENFENNSADKKKSKGEEKLSDKASTRGDEIVNLKSAMEQNTYRLRRRIEAINDVVKMERQRILRHKQAMQLLSLWCNRYEFYPGLRPNAVLLRYEPTRNLDDLLSNPLAVEYLKGHCDSDHTLENLFFLLDVSWLSELEAAEDLQEDPAKRRQIHHVASVTAATIIAYYIADDAPQQINISSATFEALRSMGTTYKRGMFKDAVSEVKLMLNTDILPRFRGTTAYSAMSENLYVDAFVDDEDSSESVSGSVLSDETTTDSSNMVGFNFKNLYAKLDGETDVGSTCTNESSVIGVDEEEEDDDVDGATNSMFDA